MTKYAFGRAKGFFYHPDCTVGTGIPPVRAPEANAKTYVFDALRIIGALILPFFLEIHKVFRRKNVFIRTQILSQFVLVV